jgi:hypothetical protein
MPPGLMALRPARFVVCGYQVYFSTGLRLCKTQPRMLLIKITFVMK